MTTIAASKEQKQLLTFPTPAAYLGFILTCLDTSEFGRDSEVFQECLNRAFISKTGKQIVHVVARGDVETMRQAQHIALANGGTAHKLQPMDRDQFQVMTTGQMIRAVRLQPSTSSAVRTSHLLVGLYEASSQALSQFLEYVWNLGVEGVEVAFVRHASRGLPGHLVKVHGIKRPEAFHAFCEGMGDNLELYAPTRHDRRGSRFYCRWGFRFPVPGLEQLAELDRELVLLRPRPQDKSTRTEWITFAAGDVNFFRRAYEFVDLHIDLDPVPLVELTEETQPPAVPIELSLGIKAKQGRPRLWQIDKQIDRQRRGLQELERMRAGMATGDFDEVYFAYRFEQEDDGQLNPQLVRLLQQRISVLSHCDYAFCQPQRGKKYHLVVTNRTQRHLGFSLQLADGVYYQPANWRRYGALNLYVPLHTELLPHVDDNDALPVLQRILEQADNNGSVVAPASECAAILWELGHDGAIVETRIPQAVPLLSQFRVLNLFQRNVAGLVEQRTRDEMAEGIRLARLRVDDDVDMLARELLKHVNDRTERLEKSYSQLEDALQTAEKLVARVEPRIEEIKQLVLTLPDQWVRFVNMVVSLHRSFMDPQLTAILEFREKLSIGRTDLRALGLRGKDLASVAERHREHMQVALNQCDEELTGNQKLDTELEQLHARAARIFRAITALHQQLGKRLSKAMEIESRAQQMQKEIDQLRQRETDAKRRLEEVKPLHAEWQKRAAEIDALAKDAESNEQTVLARSAELGCRRQELKHRAIQVSAQLQQIETCLVTVAERSQEIEQASAAVTEQLEMIEAYADAAAMWETQRETWEIHFAGQLEDSAQKIIQIDRAVADLEEHDKRLAALRDHLQQAQEILDRSHLPRKSGEEAAS